MKLITLHLPEPWILALDQLVKDKMYGCRSHAMRSAIRDLLKSEYWRDPEDSEHPYDSFTEVHGREKNI